MVTKVGNRVKETSDTTGTGTLDLGGAATGFRPFLDEFTTGDKAYYLIVDDPDNPTDYEYGIGTITAGTPDTLSRDTVEGSSNSGNKVSWSAGTKTVISTPTVGMFDTFAQRKVATLTASGSSSLDFTANAYPSLFDGTFSLVEFVLGGILPATDDVGLLLRAGTGATPTWQAGSGAYAWGTRTQGVNGGADLGSASTGPATGILISREAGGAVGLSNAAGEPLSGTVRVVRLGQAERVQFKIDIAHTPAGSGAQNLVGGGYYGSSIAITGVRFLMTSGNIASGTITAYGLR